MMIYSAIDQSEVDGQLAKTCRPLAVADLVHVS